MNVLVLYHGPVDFNPITSLASWALEIVGEKTVKIANAANKKTWPQEKNFLIPLFLSDFRLKKKIPSAKLWMVGDGSVKFPEIDGVTYFGRVSGEKKRRLMSSAHLILVPAVREGWGLVVTEANAMGTPAVAYDVPGLRDSVKHKRTGVLCDPNPESMAETVFDLHTGSSIQEYSRNALEDSRRYTWDRSAEEFLKILECS